MQQFEELRIDLTNRDRGSASSEELTPEQRHFAEVLGRIIAERWRFDIQGRIKSADKADGDRL